MRWQRGQTTRSPEILHSMRITASVVMRVIFEEFCGGWGGDVWLLCALEITLSNKENCFWHTGVL
jgi:hypothetical protein